jgi:hypothetical protein
MSHLHRPLPPALVAAEPRTVKRHLAASAVLSVATIVVMSIAYVFMPEPSESLSGYELAAAGAIGLVVFSFAVTWLFVRVRSANYPLSGGLFLLAVTIAFFILCFSWIYLVLDQSHPDSFTEPLSKVGAVYFTLSVLTTVGFGDITPTGDTTRGIVSAQMVLGVGLLAIVIKFASQSARDTIHKLSGNSDASPEHGDSETLNEAAD